MNQNPFKDDVNPYEAPIMAELARPTVNRPWYYAPAWLWFIAAPFLFILVAGSVALSLVLAGL